jgi:putative secretion ATPase (PEP-CTERM system associated)
VYEAFYGLSDKPFQLNPDPSFYFGSRQHRRAMAYLEYGLHQNEGFIVVTGEVGAGKTTIVRSLLAKLDPHKVVAAQLVSTQLDAEDTLRLVAAAFGLKTKDVAKSDLLLALEGFLVTVTTQGKRALLIVDEAQNLTPRAVEELRMLSNFQLETHALLQSFLVGQPEFRKTMQSPHMLQLRQRVIAACHIGPLDAEETRGYIEHRLKCVGWKDKPQFQPDTFAAVYQATGGIPRRINALCDRLLLAGFIGSKTAFNRSDAEEVAREIRDESFSISGSAEAGMGSELASNPNTRAAANDARVAGGQDAQADAASRTALAAGLTIDPSRINMGPEAATEASQLIAGIQATNVEERLARLERQGAATLKLLQQIVEAVRTRPAPKADAT